MNTAENLSAQTGEAGGEALPSASEIGKDITRNEIIEEKIKDYVQERDYEQENKIPDDAPIIRPITEQLEAEAREVPLSEWTEEAIKNKEEYDKRMAEAKEWKAEMDKWAAGMQEWAAGMQEWAREMEKKRDEMEKWAAGIRNR